MPVFAEKSSRLPVLLALSGAMHGALVLALTLPINEPKRPVALSALRFSGATFDIEALDPSAGAPQETFPQILSSLSQPPHRLPKDHPSQRRQSTTPPPLPKRTKHPAKSRLTPSRLRARRRPNSPREKTNRKTRRKPRSPERNLFPQTPQTQLVPPQPILNTALQPPPRRRHHRAHPLARRALPPVLSISSRPT